jgi:hypothetical protein
LLDGTLRERNYSKAMILADGRRRRDGACPFGIFPENPIPAARVQPAVVISRSFRGLPEF